MPAKKFHTSAIIRIIVLLLIVPMSVTAWPRQPERGYRGFVDWDNLAYISISLHEPGEKSKYYPGISTSHGYQFTPHVYLGAGVAADYSLTDKRFYCVPVFAHFRNDLKLGRFTPYFDARLGYNFLDGGGVYSSLSAGYRINWGRKTAINIGIGAALHGYKGKDYAEWWTPENGAQFAYSGKSARYEILPQLRIGIEF